MPSPGFDLGAGASKSGDERLVEKFVAHAAVEAHARRALCIGLPSAMMPGDALARSPGEHGVRRVLSAVIGNNHACLRSAQVIGLQALDKRAATFQPGSASGLSTAESCRLMRFARSTFQDDTNIVEAVELREELAKTLV